MYAFCFSCFQIHLSTDDVTHGTVRKWHAVARRPHFDALSVRRGRWVGMYSMFQAWKSSARHLEQTFFESVWKPTKL